MPVRNNILIVDDHPIVREGLALVIDEEPDLRVAAQAGDRAGALRDIDKLNPDLVIVDLTLKSGSGLELIKDIRQRWPHLPMLALSMHDEKVYAERVLRAGAKGYIMKYEGPDKILSAIRKVLSGQIYLSESMSDKLLGSMVGHRQQLQGPNIDRLSDRELEVFQLMGDGYGTRETAERLHLSIKTIETYRAHIKEKLDFGDASEMLRWAIQWRKQSTEY